MCISIYLSIYLSLSLSIHTHIYIHIYIYIYIYSIFSRSDQMKRRDHITSEHIAEQHGNTV